MTEWTNLLIPLHEYFAIHLTSVETLIGHKGLFLMAIELHYTKSHINDIYCNPCPCLCPCVCAASAEPRDYYFTKQWESESELQDLRHETFRWDATRASCSGVVVGCAFELTGACGCRAREVRASWLHCFSARGKSGI